MRRKFYYLAIASCAVMVMAVASSMVWTAQSSAKPTAEAATIKPTHGKCSLCYSCGGKWPVYGGALDIPSGEVEERGSGCGDGDDYPAPESDTSPYLCCAR